MNDSEKQTIVFIPRNFIEKGTFMGGMFKIRNAIEGGILAVLIAVPVIQLPLSLTVRIIILCMTALPAAMISLIGIGGESISAFLMNALRFLKNRRVIYRIDVNPDPKNKHRIKKPRNKEPKAKKHKHPKKKSTASMTASGQSDEYEGCVSDEISSHDVAISKKKERRQFDTSTKRGIRKQAREDIRILKYENRQLKKAQKQAKRAVRTELKRQKQEEKRRVREENRQKKAEIKATKQADKEREHPASDINTAPASSKPKKKKRRDMTLEDYLPIEKIANGVIYTTDHRYVKILEIEPINFLLRSTREQQSIIFSFISYLKISPVKLQIKMISKKADINKHLNQAQLELERETDPNCRQLQKDYIQFVRRLSSREAVSRRFFLIFEYEPFNVNRKVEETEILAALETAAQTAKTFLYQCGNEVVSHDNEDEFTTDVLYTLLNRTKSTEVPLPKRDVYNVLMESEDTKRLAHILNRLVHGSASSFNQQTNVDLSNKYTVLDISELTGSSDLLTVGMFVALDFVWDKAKENRTEEKAIFVDEVWQLIGASSNRLAAEFVLEIAKIIRAYSGAGIFATQDLNDFFALDDGKYGKGIINNCKTKIILNMEDEEAQRVKNILHLSETEVMNITHFQRGNGLISTNNNNITVEFKASNLEKELITTDRQELLEILKRQNEKAG